MAVFEALSRALKNRREVEFDYRRPGSTRPISRRVEPYHIAFRNSSCYLIGHDVRKKALRQYALPRMANVTVRSERFVVPDDFSVEKFFQGAFGVQGGRQGGTGDYLVRIQFDAAAAFYIRERRWHPTQTLKDLPAGGVELSMRLSDLEEVERWVLSWGVHATVMEPGELKTSMHETIEQLGRRYP
jgi:predicted DNA-binding transcriptional regulator YafY